MASIIIRNRNRKRKRKRNRSEFEFEGQIDCAHILQHIQPVKDILEEFGCNESWFSEEAITQDSMPLKDFLNLVMSVFLNKNRRDIREMLVAGYNHNKPFWSTLPTATRAQFIEFLHWVRMQPFIQSITQDRTLLAVFKRYCTAMSPEIMELKAETDAKIKLLQDQIYALRTQNGLNPYIPDAVVEISSVNDIHFTREVTESNT